MKLKNVQTLVTQEKNLQQCVTQNLFHLISNQRKYSMMSKTIVLLACLVALPVFARNVGGESGGGGDASELKVNEIRSDILKWIQAGAASELELKTISYGEYASKMTEILQPKKVIIAFVENDDSNDEELQVRVNGTPKTCRSFISVKDSSYRILCNITRFKETSPAEKYKLIHHEYAGLMGIERNEGASSDYQISSQLTDFLSEQTVLKLAIRKKEVNPCDLIITGGDINILEEKTVIALRAKSYNILISSKSKNERPFILSLVGDQKVTKHWWDNLGLAAGGWVIEEKATAKIIRSEKIDNNIRYETLAKAEGLTYYEVRYRQFNLDKINEQVRQLPACSTLLNNNN